MHLHPMMKKLDDRPMSKVDPVVRMRAFLQGDLVLADLYEMTREELYELCALGRHLFEDGRIEEAKTVFEGLTVLDPYDNNFHTGLGVVHQMEGSLDQARIEYDRAVSLCPQDIAARTNRAEVLIQQGCLEEAAVDIRCVLELDPQGTSGYTHRAAALAIAVQSIAEEVALTKN